MKRWKKVLLWILSIIVVIGVGGLFAANYAVDKLMSSMAEGFSEDEGSSNITDPVVAESEPTPEPTESSVPTEAVPSSTADPSATTSAPEPAAATTAPAATAKPTASAGTDGISHISTDKAQEVKDSVTLKDKADVAKVLTQLSASDIKRLQELAQGGLTIEEKREARSIILGNVSEDQYNELVQIAKKYGLSQGKTYAEVTKNGTNDQEGSE